MIIISQLRDMIVPFEELMEINIHQTERGLILGTFKYSHRRDIVLARYDNKDKSLKVIEMIAQALEEDRPIFYMPENNEKELNTVLRGGGIDVRKLKTTGKTK